MIKILLDQNRTQMTLHQFDIPPEWNVNNVGKNRDWGKEYNEKLCKRILAHLNRRGPAVNRKCPLFEHCKVNEMSSNLDFRDKRDILLSGTVTIENKYVYETQLCNSLMQNLAFRSPSAGCRREGLFDDDGIVADELVGGELIIRLGTEDSIVCPF